MIIRIIQQFSSSKPISDWDLEFRISRLDDDLIWRLIWMLIAAASFEHYPMNTIEWTLSNEHYRVNGPLGIPKRLTESVQVLDDPAVLKVVVAMSSAV